MNKSEEKSRGQKLLEQNRRNISTNKITVEIHEWLQNIEKQITEKTEEMWSIRRKVNNEMPLYAEALNYLSNVLQSKRKFDELNYEFVKLTGDDADADGHKMGLAYQIYRLHSEISHIYGMFVNSNEWVGIDNEVESELVRQVITQVDEIYRETQNITEQHNPLFQSSRDKRQGK